jgi:hypothetical protein
MALLALPAVLLDRVADGLTSREALRLQALVCTSLSRSVGSGGYWSRMVVARLERLVPGVLYFDGPTNDSDYILEGLTGRDRFPDHAEDCEASLEATLEAAGVPGVGWRRREGAHRERLADVMLPDGIAVAVADRSITRERFASFAEALACVGCGDDASRQCAGCGGLLCLKCRVGCSMELPKAGRCHQLCPFVLCVVSQALLRTDARGLHCTRASTTHYTQLPIAPS